MSDPGPSRPPRLDPPNEVIVDATTKGLPLDGPIRLGDVGAQGWSLEDLLPPVMVLREPALAHNVSLMAAYTAEEGIELAPHGKTTMAPQIWRRQLDAGAWGITAATVAQARVMHEAGVRRILIANEVVDMAGIRWIAKRLREDADLELLVCMDAAAAVDELAAHLGDVSRPLPVLVEVGNEGGRTGNRSIEDAVEAARRIDDASNLTLAGVTGFEGTIAADRSPLALEAVGAFLDRIASACSRIGDEVAAVSRVSAGGSAFFDLVVERLRPDRTGGARLLLRSGRYVAHEAGADAAASPFAGREPERRFRPALEVWAPVLSRPEPDVAIVSMGRRDVPFDRGPPIPFEVRASSGPRAVDGDLVVERLDDQHAYVRLANAIAIGLGDLVGNHVVHACTAFDRWRVIPVLDDEDRVIDAIATYF
jgi:D-serine deaminase-like pyridoxal phosphate-dependent protein